MLVAGALFGGPGTAVAQAADANMAYSCRFPSGAQRVGVRVRASLPKEGRIGQAVSPGKPTVAVTVPRAAFGDLTKLDAATVGATGKLTVNVAQSGASAATAWQNLGATQTALPSAGDLVLKASGVAQAVRPAAPGRVVFAAGALAVDLIPHKADGTATSPPVISLSCAPAGGSDTTIGAVAISDGIVNPPGTRQPGAIQDAPVQASASENACPPTPPHEFNQDFPEPPRVSRNGDDVREANPFVFDGATQPGCAFLEGLSNVEKLGGATSFGRSEALDTLIRFEQDVNPDVNFVRFGAVGVSHFEPRSATLISFGFVPVSATLELTSLGNTNVWETAPGFSAAPPGFPPVFVFPDSSIAQGKFSLRLTDARVNGVPLNVGTHCRSAEPLEITLNGGSLFDPSYRLTAGGMLNGEVTIPPWIGCGVGEDLDPLLTATVSGPGNLVSVTQGPVCSGVNNAGAPCPPLPFGYTVDPGGQWTATSDRPFGMEGLSIGPLNPSFSCGSAMMKGSLRSGSGVNPAPIGQVTDFSPLSCTATQQSGTDTGPLNGKQFTITPVGLPWKLHADSFNPGTDSHPISIVKGHFEGATLHFATQGCSFDVTDKAGFSPSTSASGSLVFWYDNSTHAFSFIDGLESTGSGLPISSETVEGCEGVTFDPFSSSVQFPQLGGPVLHMPVDPPQTIIQPRPRCANETECPDPGVPR